MHSFSTTFPRLKPTSSFLRPCPKISPVPARVTTESQTHPPPSKIHQLTSNMDFLSAIFLGLKPTGVKRALLDNAPVLAKATTEIPDHHPRPINLSARTSIPSNTDFLATVFLTLQPKDVFKRPLVTRASTTNIPSSSSCASPPISDSGNE